jgi:hypothetical protein
MSMIEDGLGTGLRAQVNAKNRLVTESVTFDREDDAISSGVGYQLTSGQVAYTNTSAGVPVGVFYMKNLEAVDVVLDRVVLMIGTATGATGDWFHRIIRNPTGGSLIGNAVPGGISNSNHGSANILNGGDFIYKGIETDDVTGGTGVPLPIQIQSNRILFPIGRRIPKNSSFAIEITPPAGISAAISVTVCHVFVDVNQL